MLDDTSQKIRDIFIYNDNIAIAPNQTNNNFFKTTLLGTSEQFLHPAFFPGPQQETLLRHLVLYLLLAGITVCCVLGTHNLSP